MKRTKQRQAAKAKRGRGQLAMKIAAVDQTTWTQLHDPLYTVKGIERYRRKKGNA